MFKIPRHKVQNVVSLQEATQKTDRSFILLKLLQEKISPPAHSGVNATNRQSLEGLGHVGINKS